MKAIIDRIIASEGLNDWIISSEDQNFNEPRGVNFEESDVVIKQEEGWDMVDLEYQVEGDEGRNGQG